MTSLILYMVIMTTSTNNFLLCIFIYLFIKALRSVGPTACLKLLHKVCLKRWRKEKKSMTGPGQP